MCLKVSSERLNGTRARDACESEGARLVKIDTEEKNDAIVEILKKEYSDLFHIGLFKNHTGDGSWRWTDNSVLVYNNWLPSSQRMDGPFTGLNMVYDGVSSYWRQVYDFEMLRYICEKP
ncbi:CD302 antigen-like [Gigantopelta aegis]|uniref:CD302 antigen-like n=1 Tax=Gigantopelta aegis TaxID=1735272 RepID=UPI001B88D28C|nr:CD302 antigen-like [Gigantopelta aegis]